MMDKNLLYRYFIGHASANEIHQVRTWSDESDENQNLLRRERKLFNAMIMAGSVKKPMPINNDKIYRPTNRIWLRIVGMAACIAAICCISIITIFIGHSDTQLAMQTIHVPSGQSVDLILPDSSHVWLNANTRMTYPLSFVKGIREVSIEGEAFFEVKHHDKWPFIVHTPHMDVKVLGTKFNVEAYSDKPLTETSLIEGKVQITLPKQDGVSQQYILQPGRKLSLTENQVAISKITDQEVYRWRYGLYCFNNKTIVDIMHDFEKYYGIKIIVQEEHLKKVVLSGKFRIAEGLNYALDVLKSEVHFSYHRSSDNNTLFIK